MTNENYLEKLKNMVDMLSAFKRKIHDQDIVYIVTQDKNIGSIKNIIYPEYKETVEKVANEQ